MWAVILFWILLGLAVAQALLGLAFLGTLRRARPASTEAAPCVKTAVILCLRGSDPSLPACLEGILHQDYPHYDVRIVVDSLDDPAWETVERVVARSGVVNVHVRPLTDRRPTCSLKCSSLLQAISELDGSYEIVALIDADIVPHRTWLRDLVAPLREDRVAVAAGNRWYMPASLSWASLMRWLWNAAAVVHMYWYRIPWGGSLALRMSAFRQGRLQERWAHSFGEDTMLYSVFRRLGHRVAFVPSLMMVNREDCSVASFYGWVRRQLFTTRLNHPAWTLVAGHGLAVSLAQGIGMVALIVAAIAKDGPAVGWLLAGLGLYWSVMAGLLIAMETGVRRVLAARGEPTAWLKVSDLFRVGIAMLLTQAIYLAALVCALGLRQVDWRGIRYRTQGRGQIRMERYEPYTGQAEPEWTSQSL